MGTENFESEQAEVDLGNELPNSELDEVQSDGGKNDVIQLALHNEPADPIVRIDQK
jgi:hypothetical protein